MHIRANLRGHEPNVREPSQEAGPRLVDLQAEAGPGCRVQGDEDAYIAEPGLDLA